MDLQTPNAQVVADFCRLVLSDVLDELVDEVSDDTELVKQSLRNISNLYKTGLRFASAEHRSDWDDPANRCAYVFLYLMQHCYIVYSSLQNCDDVSKSWRNRNKLKVCSIGGGPGSDLVGLTTFLRENSIFPPSLECLVLDLYPNWKFTWDTIYDHVPEGFSVTYSKCDLVRDTKLSTQNLQFVKQADILTLSKSFSAVSAFFRADPGKGSFLRSILREIKPGCFVLFIDNDYVGCTQFQQGFASRAGLDLMFEFRGKPTLPSGPYSHTIRKYCRLFEFSPMRSCSVIIQLFRKKGSVQTRPAAKHEINPPSGVAVQDLYGFIPRKPLASSSGHVSSTYRSITHDVVSSRNHGVSTKQTTPEVSSSGSISISFPRDSHYNKPHGISTSHQLPPSRNISITSQPVTRNTHEHSRHEHSRHEHSRHELSRHEHSLNKPHGISPNPRRTTAHQVPPSSNPPGITGPTTRTPHETSLYSSPRLPSTGHYRARDGDDKTSCGCFRACSIL